MLVEKFDYHTQQINWLKFPIRGNLELLLLGWLSRPHIKYPKIVRSTAGQTKKKTEVRDIIKRV